MGVSPAIGRGSRHRWGSKRRVWHSSSRTSASPPSMRLRRSGIWAGVRGLQREGWLPYRPPNPKSKYSLLAYALERVLTACLATCPSLSPSRRCGSLTSCLLPPWRGFGGQPDCRDPKPRLLAMRYGGALPGAETTAPAQHISSEAAIERVIAETSARDRSRALCAACGNESGLGGQTRRREHSCRWSWTS